MLFRLFRLLRNLLPHFSNRTTLAFFISVSFRSRILHIYIASLPELPRITVDSDRNLNSYDCNARIKTLRITELSISRRISWVHSALPRKALKSRGGIGPLASKRRARSYPVTSISRERSGPFNRGDKGEGSRP